jgi:hypothetical protein
MTPNDQEDYDAIIRIDTWMIHYGTKIDEMHEVIHGNGDPSKGMIVRMDRVETFVGVVKKIFWIIAGAGLVGAIGLIF